MGGPAGHRSAYASVLGERALRQAGPLAAVDRVLWLLRQHEQQQEAMQPRVCVCGGGGEGEGSRLLWAAESMINLTYGRIWEHVARSAGIHEHEELHAVAGAGMLHWPCTVMWSDFLVQ